jgi:hypothetical protein
MRSCRSASLSRRQITPSTYFRKGASLGRTRIVAAAPSLGAVQSRPILHRCGKQDNHGAARHRAMPELPPLVPPVLFESLTFEPSAFAFVGVAIGTCSRYERAKPPLATEVECSGSADEREDGGPHRRLSLIFTSALCGHDHLRSSVGLAMTSAPALGTELRDHRPERDRGVGSTPSPRAPVPVAPARGGRSRLVPAGRTDRIC